MNPQPREALAELVQTYGPDLLDDARRVRALLYDTCPGDRREVGVLVAAVEEGIPLSISRASESISVSGELDRLTTQLEDSRGLSYDAARWAVRSWAWVLGLAEPPVDQEGGATRERPSEPSTPSSVPPLAPAPAVPPTAPLPGRADADAVTRRVPPSRSGRGGPPRRRPRRPLVLAAIAAVLLVPAVLVPVALATSRRRTPPPATTLNGPTTAPTIAPTTAPTSPPTTASPVRPPTTASTTTTRTPTTPTTESPTTQGPPAQVTQVAPEDGAVFDHFPRDTTLTWSAVGGAAQYKVEVDFCAPAGCDASASPLRRESVSSTSFRFRFVGAQPGRWRVRAVSAAGAEGPNSPWRGFRYTI